MKESRHSMEQVKNAMPTSIQPHYSSNERNLNNVSRAQVVLKKMKQPMSYDFCICWYIFFIMGCIWTLNQQFLHCFTLFFGYYQCWNEYGLLDEALVHQKINLLHG
jgi:hypothetical protein